MSLRTALGMCVAAMAIFFAGVYAAHARPGVAGGAARSSVTVAGTLTGAGLPAPPMPVSATFVFKRRTGDGGTTDMVLCRRDVLVRRDTGGGFSEAIELEDCAGGPERVFDGSDVYVDVQVGGATVVTDQAVTPVPYAHYASIAGMARVAEQYGTPDCPMGYERNTTEAGFPDADGIRRLCQRRRADGTLYDEVVRVGAWASAFWIDRYEAIVTAGADGSGLELGGAAGIDNYGDTFPDNGQWTSPRYALSGALPSGRTPSRLITWFQAAEACAASGKRLPSGEEWLRAANGTADVSPGLISPLLLHEIRVGGGDAEVGGELRT